MNRREFIGAVAVATLSGTARLDAGQPVFDSKRYDVKYTDCCTTKLSDEPWRLIEVADVDGGASSHLFYLQSGTSDEAALMECVSKLRGTAK